MCLVNILQNCKTTGELGRIRQHQNQTNCISVTMCFTHSHVCCVFVLKYSSKLESVTQKLQAVQLDLLGAQAAIKEHLVEIRADRNNSDERYSDSFKVTKNLADEIGLGLKPPRQARR